MEAERADVVGLAEAADRLDALAEVAELMGDDDGALRFRTQGSRCREQAMRLLDPGHRAPPPPARPPVDDPGVDPR